MVADTMRPAAKPPVSKDKPQEAISEKKWHQNGPAPDGELKNHRSAMVKGQEGKTELDETLNECESPTPSLSETVHFDNTSFSTRRRLAICNLPFPRNTHFAHREEVLSEIHDALQCGLQRVRTGDTQECPAVALVGMGGIGKTQVALEYCYRHREDYEVILWFRADTAHMLSNDLQEAARIQGLLNDEGSASSYDGAWWKLLQQASSSWLLVYDNADDIDVLPQFLTSKACIIITSRDHIAFRIANVQNLIVSPMSHDEGMSFLLQLLDRSSSIPSEELDAASALTHELGGHPLALAQFAGLIRERSTSIARIRAIYAKHQDQLLKRPTRTSSSYHHTVATVWASAFVHLSERAVQLLWLLSVLDPDGVALELLKAAPMGEIMDWATDSDHFELYKLLHELQTAALITRQSPGDTVAIHRLVQTVARQRCPEAKLIQVFSLAASCILRSLESEHRQVDAQSEESLTRHLIALEGCVQEFARNRNPVNIEELQDLQTYVRERRWLMNHHSQLVTESTLIHNEGQEPEDIDWASTTTLVHFPMQHEAADEIFAKLFASDPQFTNLASALLELVSKEIFKRKCADLLSLFSIHLQDEQPSSADLFQELKVFAQNVTKFVTAFEKALDNARLEDSMRKAQYSDKASANHAVIDATDGDSRRHSNVGILDTAPGFLEQGPAAHMVFSAESDAQDIEQKHKSEGFGTASSDFVSFVLESEALQRLKKELDTQSQLYQAEVKKSKRPLGKPEQVSGSIHLSSNPTRRRQPKTVTVTWKCRCGVIITDQYTEFVEGAVQTYIEERTLRHKSWANVQNTSPGTRGWFDPIRGTLKGISNQLNRSFVRRQTQSQETTKSRVADGGSVESPPVSNPTGRPNHLQLCISRHRRYTQTSYTSQSLKIESDKMLYDFLRAQYTELTGRWKRLLSLRQISQIRFVKFRLRTNKLVTIEVHSEMEARIRESLPRENDDDYDFAPPEPDFLPPIGHNEMMHYFYEPCTGQDDDLHIRRFPGHKLNPVPFQPTEEEKHVWGIELVESESREWLYLSIPVFIVFFSSMAFGIIWTVVLQDIQGGFTVAGYIVTSGLALLGSIQVFLENV